MNRRTQFKLAALACCLIALLGCAAKTTTTGTTPTAPTPPQVSVLQYTQLGAAAVNTVSHELVPLCPAPPAVPTLDLVMCNKVKNLLLTASCPPGKSAGTITCPSTGGMFDQVAAEASSADSWATMKAKFATILSGFSGQVATLSINNPTLNASIAGIQNIINKILGVI